MPEANRTAYKVYTPSSSFTKVTNDALHEGYPNGLRVDGYVGTDILYLGGFQARGVFGVATRMVDFKENIHDGILGLAHTGVTGKTTFNSFRDQLALPLFTLTTDHDNLAFEFGAIDSRYKSQIRYSPQANISVFWGTHIAGYQVLGREPDSRSWDSILGLFLFPPHN